MLLHESGKWTTERERGGGEREREGRGRERGGGERERERMSAFCCFGIVDNNREIGQILPHYVHG